MICLVPAESRVTHQQPTIFQDAMAGRIGIYSKAH